jgi:hypothetical protein
MSGIRISEYDTEKITGRSSNKNKRSMSSSKVERKNKVLLD